MNVTDSIGEHMTMGSSDKNAHAERTHADSHTKKRYKQTNTQDKRKQQRRGRQRSAMTASSAAVLLRVACILAMASVSWGVNGASASIRVSVDGTMHVGSEDQDVVVSGVGINSVQSRINSLGSLQDATDQLIQSIVIELSSMTTSVTAASASLSAMQSRISQLSEFKEFMLSGSSNTCSLVQAPQNLSRVYETFSLFTRNGQLYVVAEDNVLSHVYKWQGVLSRFQVVQSLVSAYNAARVTAFTMYGTQYVALPSYFDGTKYECLTELFVFDDHSERLTSFQNISSSGASGVAVASIGDETYLVLTNARNATVVVTTNATSYVMRFNNSTRQFEHWQNISTGSAMPAAFFQLDDGSTMLMLPNQHGNTSFIANSDILQYDVESMKFVWRQSIVTDGVTTVKVWRWKSEQFISIVNYHGQYTDVLMLNSTTGEVERNTSRQACRLPSLVPIFGVDVMEIDGNMYMCVASYTGTYAQVYRWQDDILCFETLQQLPTPTAAMTPTFARIKGDAYLLLGQTMYKWCDGQFALG
jgi:hypothetical protein